MNPARVGSVRFLNTRPLIDGLDGVQGLSFHPAVPSHLVGMLQTSHVDIALVSLIDAARSPVPLALLPAGMIGSDGPTLTVRLFSPVEPSLLEEVWADTDSHTSIALCQLLLDRVHGATPGFRAFNAREQMPLGRPTSAGTAPSSKADRPGPRTGVLLIGDKVVTDPPDPAAFPVVMDLGEAWKRWTGLPFVYATWMCRAADIDRPELHVAAGLLDRQRRHNMTRLDAIASAHAPQAGWPLDLARRYLSHHLQFDLGPREQTAAQRFIDEAAAIGACPNHALRWIDWRPGARAAASPARDTLPTPG